MDVNYICVYNVCAYKVIANGPVGQVLARPLFLKVKTKFYFTKASNKQKY